MGTMQTKTMNKPYAADQPLRVGMHVVCLLDILGQKQKLAKWPAFPNGSAPSSEFVAALKQTLGTLIAFRDQFERFFRTVSESTLGVQLDRLTPAQLEEYLRYKQCDLHVQQFSDTFVFFAPIGNNHGDVSAIGLHNILGACCVAMIVSLAARNPLRGAITVGMGVEHEKDNFYGPALAEAHALESEAAKSPRIVVSPRVNEFIGELLANPAATGIESKMKTVAAICKKMITVDSDGISIIDFIGPGVHESHRGSDAIRMSITLARSFVDEQVREYDRTGDEKLLRRYANLQSYLESRAALWK